MCNFKKEIIDSALTRDELNKKGIVATVRKSRGQDIAAACGLLSTSQLSANKK